jgi:DNA-binding NarL/FixJ family response regulator
VAARIRILLVDDHETVRHGLKLLIDSEPDMQVVAEANDGAGALDPGVLNLCDLVVMDLSMPGIGGVTATRRLKQLRPDLPVVSLTRHAEQALLEELLRAGARGYVLKQSSHDELLRAIRAAAEGRQYIDPALTHCLAAAFLAHGVKRACGDDDAQPSSRELDVLRRVSRGYSNKEIASDLMLSVKTVEVHKANAMRRLGLTGRIELLRYAVKQGWLHDS